MTITTNTDEEYDTEENTLLVKPKEEEPVIPLSEHLFKYLGLLFMCLVILGAASTFDVPAAFGSKVISEWYHVNEVDYGVLYSVYSFPNLVLVVVGGYLIDSLLGLRLGLLVFTGFIAIGQIIFAISANARTFWLAILGRLIYGVGGETIYIVAFAYVSVWFFGRKDFALAFSTVNTVGRLAGAIDLSVTTDIADHFSLPVTIWIGTFLCLFSFVAGLVLSYLETLRLKKVNPLIDQKEQDKKAEIKQQKKFKISDVKKFPLQFWLILFFINCYVIPVFSFITIGTDFFKTHFPHLNTSALISIPFYLACLAPLLGALVDKFGRNLYFLTVSSVLALVAFIFLMFKPVTPYISVIFLGISMATIYSASFTLINPLVPEYCISVCFALNSALTSGSMALTIIGINSILQKNNNDYTIIFVIYILLILISIVTLVILIIMDRKHQLINVPPEIQKEKIKERKEKEEALDRQREQEQNPLIVN
ncbi:major facilitator superfamily domain-containing protein 1 [Tieghemostelium lacteum]|uniref:Lysosomal dipeptide transporter MFSD1 n=1 Tax=Tieghemostelium lacteum TaxID=361077 RepID=A0A152A0U9_TIELA|nr:major facilitator superfamily domain-containing protein 1 [Tieghemostelium lacteum]|eukprot:KYQ99839.1 major facilitator superfamily domain-containing protein 1 [Tieghemostelium lacteum]